MKLEIIKEVNTRPEALRQEKPKIRTENARTEIRRQESEEKKSDSEPVERAIKEKDEVSNSGKKTKPKAERKRLSKKEIIIIFAAIAAICVIVGIIVYKNLTSYRFTSSANYFVSGIAMPVSDGDSASIDRNGAVTIKKKDGEDIIADDKAVFFYNQNCILTVIPMSFYRSFQDTIFMGKLVTPLTKVSVNGTGVTFEKNGKQIDDAGEFLFDGKDTYILLAEGDLYIDGEMKAHLSPLSYVKNNYINWVEYWDHDRNDYSFIETSSDKDYIGVDVVFSQDGVVLHCDLDRVTTASTDHMLTSALEIQKDVLE